VSADSSTNRVAAALRDILRRSDTLTSAAVRLAGRFQSLRDRRLSARDRWAKHTSDESRYWLDALSAADANERFADRLDPDREISGDVLRRAVEEIDTTEVAILDVGSGPLTSVGKTHPGKRINVVAIDALADEYIQVLGESGVKAPVLPEACSGEEILDKYEPQSFDVAFIANALDHTADPLLVLDNMLGVVKPNGRVALWHLRNEGERNRYFGIHLWNIDCRDDRFVVWNREVSHDINARLDGRYDVECWSSDDDRISCLIRPRI
jgi:2-polyprenyl-3-methyl-5-hydroxy-6-metoxy-1,4-benzoquinol methylase